MYILQTVTTIICTAYDGNQKVTFIPTFSLSKTYYILLSLMVKFNTCSLTRQDDPKIKLKFTFKL